MKMASRVPTSIRDNAVPESMLSLIWKKFGSSASRKCQMVSRAWRVSKVSKVTRSPKVVAALRATGIEEYCGRREC